MELSVFSLSPFLLNNFQKISRILLADVFLFEAPVFGGGALDGDGTVASAVRQLMVSARAGLFGAVDWIEQTSNLTTNVSA